MDELDIFIGGQWRRGGGNLMQSRFPADGSLNASLYAASPTICRRRSTAPIAHGGSRRGGPRCRISGQRSCIRSPI